MQRRRWCRGRLDSDIDAGFAVGVVDRDTVPLLVREAPVKLVAIGLTVRVKI